MKKKREKKKEKKSQPRVGSPNSKPRKNGGHTTLITLKYKYTILMLITIGSIESFGGGDGIYRLAMFRKRKTKDLDHVRLLGASKIKRKESWPKMGRLKIDRIIGDAFNNSFFCFFF